jgi:hypothetical protein
MIDALIVALLVIATVVFFVAIYRWTRSDGI